VLVRIVKPRFWILNSRLCLLHLALTLAQTLVADPYQQSGAADRPSWVQPVTNTKYWNILREHFPAQLGSNMGQPIIHTLVQMWHDLVIVCIGHRSLQRIRLVNSKINVVPQKATKPPYRTNNALVLLPGGNLPSFRPFF
jgi:hypothetical protein